ncbi:MAG: DUF362 domain-containing protein [Acidobacteriota bacterium]|nr:MAG: DUF362 domain-containing protein [Acidobacteriota bacterium]
MQLLYGETRAFQGEDRRRENRREWLQRILATSLVTPFALNIPSFANSTSGKSEASKWSMPGLFPGRVSSVFHPGSMINGEYQSEPVREMIREAMVGLTGAPDWVAAWRMFFEPGEVVGIKLNPSSYPYVISAPAVVQEIIAGLVAAGIRHQDIVVYDRYKGMFFSAGFDKWLPEGVRISWAADYSDPTQQRMDGYDPDHWMDMQLTLPGFDFSNERARRSYVARFLTKEVDKLVNLCLLKHHQSAGITNALKNLSHGVVNNVNRSHSSPMLNACGSFIPTSVSIPVIRNKTVLHICDAVQALSHGGPIMKPEATKFVWAHKRIYASTDPVAMDKLGWEVLDQQRAAMGMKPLAEAPMDEFSEFVRMQPEHVDIAGALGLGIADREKIRLIERTLG